MLPGFRFFLATIVLAASVLIFGLGAAALLRATHEEFAVAPSLRTMQPPQPIRAQRPETATPALAMLRVEIPATEALEPASAGDTESASSADAPEQAVDTRPAATEPAPQEEAPSAAIPSSTTDTVAASPDLSRTKPAAAPAAVEVTPAPMAAETAPAPQTIQPNVDTASDPSASVPVTEVAPAVPTPAPAVAAATAPPIQTVAAIPVVTSPQTAEVASPVANAPAQAQAPDPSSTRLVAVSATGCEILPSTPDRPGAIPEAPRAASQHAQDNPAKDKTAKLEKEPAANVPKAPSRPAQQAKPRKPRPTAIKHRHHTASRARHARHEAVRPQPPQDLFTILFGGGAQPAPLNQPTR